MDDFNTKINDIANLYDIPKRYLNRFKKKLIKYGIENSKVLEEIYDEIIQRLNYERDNLANIFDFLAIQNPDFELKTINYLTMRLRERKIVFTHQNTLIYFTGDFFTISKLDIIKLYSKTQDESLLNNYEIKPNELLKKSDCCNEEWIRLDNLTKLLSIDQNNLVSLIESGDIKAKPTKTSFLVSKKQIDRIISEQSTWLSLLDTVDRRSEKLKSEFSSNHSEDRQKLMRFLSNNNFLDIEFKGYGAIKFSQFEIRKDKNKYEKDLFFRETEKIKFFKSIDVFLISFNSRKEDLILKLRQYNITKNSKTREKYDEFLKYEVSLIKNQHAMVYLNLIFADKELFMMNNIEFKEFAAFCRTKNENIALAQFANYLKTKCIVGYTHVSRDNSPPLYTFDTNAYTLKQIVCLAKAIFEKSELKKNNVIIKALESDFICQAWLFVSIFFIVGWRSADVFRNWKYLDSIDIEDFETKVKSDLIPTAELIKAADIIINKIELNPNYPHKTGTKASGYLDVTMTESIKAHIGLILLILANHKKNGKHGQLLLQKSEKYQNNQTLVSIFGSNLQDALNNENFQTRKMNKYYLQSIHKIAQNHGNSPLAAYTIAALARNHKINFIPSNTTSIYLEDGSL